MKLTKENYEFLLFELLEGNLGETEKNVLMEEINKDSFYQREWTLMQHAVATPDSHVMMAEKDSLLKPERRIIAFAAFRPMFKIAASLLLIGIAGWWFYSKNTSTEIVAIPLNTSAPQAKIAEAPLQTENSLKQTNNKKRTTMVYQTGLIKAPIVTPILPTLNTDNTLPRVPEMLLIKPLENEGIAYNIGANEVITPEFLKIEKPKTKEQNKLGQLIAQAEKIRTTTKEYWNDIPNLKLKITPKLKERNIGFELKGETIYASAILEIK